MASTISRISTILIVLSILFYRCSLVSGSQLFDIENVSYNIENRIEGNILACTQNINFNIREKTYNKLIFYVYPNSGSRGQNFEIDSAFVNGARVNYTLDSNLLVINLLKPITPSTNNEVRFYFEVVFAKGDLSKPAYVVGGVFFAGDWYLKLAEFDLPSAKFPFEEKNYRRSDYKVELTVPEKYEAVGSGRQILEVRNLNGLKTVGWEVKKSDGFAFFASEKFSIFSMTTHGKQIRYCTLKTPESARAVLNEANSILDYYTELFSDFSYPVLNIVDLPLPVYIGGAAIPTFVLLPTGKNLLSEIAKSILPTSNSLPHEIAHQWWGISVSTQDDEGNWLSEALSEYSTYLYLKNNAQDKRSIDNFLSEHEILSSAYALDARANRDKPLKETNDQEIIYGKGFYVVKMLGETMGEEKLIEALRDFKKKYEFKEAVFEDFIKTCEEFSQKDLKLFFDLWVYSNKKCDYALQSVVSRKNEKENQFENKVVIHRFGEIMMPVEVEMDLKKGGRITKTVEGIKASDTIFFNTESQLEKVKIDPEKKLLDINRYNNQRPVGLKFNFLSLSPFNDPYYHLVFFPNLHYSEQFGWDMGLSIYGKGNVYYYGFPQSYGDHTWNGNLTYNWRERSFVTKITYFTCLRKLTAKSIVFGGISVYNKHGKRGLEPYLELNAWQSSSSPWLTLKFSGQKMEYYQLNYLPANLWSRGEITFLNFEIAYNDFKRGKKGSGGLVFNSEMKAASKILGGDYNFNKFKIDTGFYKNNLLFWSCLGGLDGESPPQELLDLAVEGNFKGLPLYSYRGKKLLSSGIELKVDSPLFFALIPFLTFGTSFTKEKEFLEGGIGIGISPGLKTTGPGILSLRFDFPFWENKSISNSKQVSFRRWMFRLGFSYSQEQWFRYRRTE